MKAIVVTLIIGLLALPAFADQNPDIAFGLDSTDPPSQMNHLAEVPAASFNVYLVLSCFGEGGGTRGLGVLFERTFPGYKLGQTSLLGGLDMGDIEDDGWSLVAGADCVYPALGTDYVVAGYIEYLPTGPGTIQILPHPVSGQQVLDCNDLMDYFCIYANFGIVTAPPAPDDECFFCEPSAVEDATWGAIKSLYR